MPKNRVSLSEYKHLSSFKEEEKNPHFETQYLDEEILSLAIEFYNNFFGYFQHPITREEAFHYADLGARLNADLWKSMMQMNREKMDLFYKITPFYFFHDILRFMDGIHRANLDKWREDATNDMKWILDFAGGTGGYSIAFARTGSRVDFVDSNNIQSEWVKFIANRLSLDITVYKSLDGLTGPYDFIIAQDVVEHVFDPVSLLNYLTRLGYTNGAGNTMISVSEMPCCGPEEFAPMHFKVMLDRDKGQVGFDLNLNYRLMDMTLEKYRGLMLEQAKAIKAAKEQDARQPHKIVSNYSDQK